VRAWLLCHQVIRAADGAGAAAADGAGAEELGYHLPGPGAVGDLLVNPNPPGGARTRRLRPPRELAAGIPTVAWGMGDQGAGGDDGIAKLKNCRGISVSSGL
jgi:hypothetical protein